MKEVTKEGNKGPVTGSHLEHETKLFLHEHVK
jgi:hypothetical protein